MSGRDPAEALRATARVLDAAAAVSATDWDACAGGGNPFLSHAFFVALAVSRSEEHTSELQSLMRRSYAVFCLKKKNTIRKHTNTTNHKTKHESPHKIQTTTKQSY